VNIILRDGIDVSVAFRSISKGGYSDENRILNKSKTKRHKRSGNKQKKTRLKRYMGRVERLMKYPFKKIFDNLEFIPKKITKWLMGDVEAAVVKSISSGLVKGEERIRAEISALLGALIENNEKLNNRIDLLNKRIDLLDQYNTSTAMRKVFNINLDTIVVRTSVGYVLCPASDFALIAILLEAGDLEIGTRRLIEKYIGSEDVFVDVGANIGLHTLAAARAMHGKGKVVAFEQYEPTMRMLEKTVWTNGFSDIVEIHRAAVSNAPGTTRLHIGAASGHHSLFPLDRIPFEALAPVEVPVVRLDDILQSGQRVDLLKIDVEGAELQVVEGAASLIRDNPDIALIVEFGPSHLQRAGYTVDQWLEQFRGMGLVYRGINQISGDLEFLLPEALREVESVNLFFAREGSSAWARLS
jgi:FkbM family methyltransferase